MARRNGGAGAWLGLAVAGAAFGFLFFGERRWPLRRRVAPGVRRIAANVGVAALSAATLQVVDRPVTRPFAVLAGRRRLGLVPRLPLPGWARTALAVLLLDYTLWVWHVLLHRWAPLWRLHAFHHEDRDLDVTTGIRFHAGELVASVPWRLLQIGAIGADARALTLWQSALFLSVLFHHSNLRLPLGLERVLAYLLVTPRQHGIHHSVVLEEADSNWSSLLNVWDRAHGSLRLDVPQAAIVIGRPEIRERAALLGTPAGILAP
jgi:sterol desaturase/sphingolipid hydroxylase (fatty acid hydroxylase superfamily)